MGMVDLELYDLVELWTQLYEQRCELHAERHYHGEALLEVYLRNRQPVAVWYLTQDKMSDEGCAKSKNATSYMPIWPGQKHTGEMVKH